MPLPIRVLHVLPWVTSGGVERRRLELARALDAKVFEQRVVCLQARDSLRADFLRAGVTVDVIGGSGSPWDFGSVLKVARLARAFSPHIIHGAVFEGVTLATLAGRLARVPNVVVEEISDGENRSRRAQLLFRAYAQLATECVAVSQYAKQQLVNSGIPSRHIRVIVNGVSPPVLPSPERVAELRGLWGLAPQDFVVCTAGRLHNEHKRITDLLDAFARLKAAVPNAKLLIIGAGQEQRALEEHARLAGVRESVTFAGYLKHVGEGFALADVFCLASARESFGLAAVEAMLTGLPVVASAVGGLREIVDDGATGFLIPPFSPPRLADALLTLARDPARRRNLGDAGRARAEALFGAARYTSEVDALYRSLAVRRGVGS